MTWCASAHVSKLLPRLEHATFGIVKGIGGAAEVTQRERDRVLAHLAALADGTRALEAEAAPVGEHAHVIVVAARHDADDRLAARLARQHAPLLPVALAARVAVVGHRPQAFVREERREQHRRAVYSARSD